MHHTEAAKAAEPVPLLCYAGAMMCAGAPLFLMPLWLVSIYDQYTHSQITVLGSTAAASVSLYIVPAVLFDGWRPSRALAASGLCMAASGFPWNMFL